MTAIVVGGLDAGSVLKVAEQLRKAAEILDAKAPKVEAGEVPACLVLAEAGENLMQYGEQIQDVAFDAMVEFWLDMRRRF